MISFDDDDDPLGGAEDDFEVVVESFGESPRSSARPSNKKPIANISCRDRSLPLHPPWSSRKQKLEDSLEDFLADSSDDDEDTNNSTSCRKTMTNGVGSRTVVSTSSSSSKTTATTGVSVSTSDNKMQRMGITSEKPLPQGEKEDDIIIGAFPQQQRTNFSDIEDVIEENMLEDECDEEEKSSSIAYNDDFEHASSSVGCASECSDSSKSEISPLQQPIAIVNEKNKGVNKLLPLNKNDSLPAVENKLQCVVKNVEEHDAATAVGDDHDENQKDATTPSNTNAHNNTKEYRKRRVSSPSFLVRTENGNNNHLQSGVQDIFNMASSVITSTAEIVSSGVPRILPSSSHELFIEDHPVSDVLSSCPPTSRFVPPNNMYHHHHHHHHHAGDASVAGAASRSAFLCPFTLHTSLVPPPIACCEQYQDYQRADSMFNSSVQESFCSRVEPTLHRLHTQIEKAKMLVKHKRQPRDDDVENLDNKEDDSDRKKNHDEKTLDEDAIVYDLPKATHPTIVPRLPPTTTAVYTNDFSNRRLSSVIPRDPKSLRFEEGLRLLEERFAHPSQPLMYSRLK